MRGGGVKHRFPEACQVPAVQAWLSANTDWLFAVKSDVNSSQGRVFPSRDEIGESHWEKFKVIPKMDFVKRSKLEMKVE